ESTGGPQQMSGTKAVLYPWVADEQPGVTVSAGIMTQLQLSYLAAGCKGAGLWAWNHRRAGFEGGEYGLLDRNEQVCERTVRVGQIARAANQLRDELWTGRRQPPVGILVDFDNEAVWAAISQCQRDIFKYRGVEGRIGAARTCIDASIPFEHLTGRDLEAGLAGRYPIIFLPSVIGLKLSHLPVLIDYVRAGGRVVMDMPGGCYDHTGRVMDTRAGSDFETLFGAELQDLQYSGNNADWLIDGEKIEGFTCDLKLTSAEAVQTYHNGQPAVTENRLGDGSAVIVGYEAARACYRPGHTSWQERLAEILLGGAQPFYRCEGQPVAYRLACDGADHYFLVNEGPAAEARFTRLPYDYTRVTDVLTGQAVDIHTPIEVADDDGRWLRCQRADG
ncbi:MAG: beta-galactosidase trimerization domain-containing protein, partial [Planctomycetota bacterium]